MKRFFGFIFMLFLMFSFSGCSEEYQSERYLYKAVKLAAPVIMAPDAVPPVEFNKILASYELVFMEYPDSAAARRARMGIGSLYLVKKEYTKAREVFYEVLKLYPEDKALIMESRFAIAKSYESQGLWDKAFAEYQWIVRDYPYTEIGLNLPMYIARHYEKEKDIIEMNNAYREAVSHYKKIVKKNPNAALGLRAQDLITTCYVKQDNWQEALNSLDKIVMEYPMAKTVLPAMRLIGDISVNKLNDPRKAADIFNKFLKKYPKHPINDSLKKGLEALNNVSTAKQ